MLVCPPPSHSLSLSSSYMCGLHIHSSRHPLPLLQVVLGCWADAQQLEQRHAQNPAPQVPVHMQLVPLRLPSPPSTPSGRRAWDVQETHFQLRLPCFEGYCLPVHRTPAIPGVWRVHVQQLRLDHQGDGGWPRAMSSGAGQSWEVVPLASVRLLLRGRVHTSTS